MKKFVKFDKSEHGHHVVTCGKQALGCVEPKGEVFKKRVVFPEDIDSVEWTSECLYQLADFMAELEGTRSTADNSAMVPCPLHVSMGVECNVGLNTQCSGKPCMVSARHQ